MSDTILIVNEMEFYSTLEQDIALAAEYDVLLASAQNKIVYPYTAKSHVSKPKVIIHVSGAVVEGKGTGTRYILDKDFSTQVAQFQNKHKNYKVIFNPSGRYGPMIGYHSPDGATPAVLVSEDGADTLLVDDDDKYSL